MAVPGKRNPFVVKRRASRPAFKGKCSLDNEREKWGLNREIENDKNPKDKSIYYIVYSLLLRTVSDWEQ